MVRPQRALAVVLLAGALCADRLAVPAPAGRPSVAQAARSFAARLAVSFQRVIPAMRLALAQPGDRATDDAVAVRPTAQRPAHGAELTSAQMPLPPPRA